MMHVLAVGLLAVGAAWLAILSVRRARAGSWSATERAQALDVAGTMLLVFALARFVPLADAAALLLPALGMLLIALGLREFLVARASSRGG